MDDFLETDHDETSMTEDDWDSFFKDVAEE